MVLSLPSFHAMPSSVIIILVLVLLLSLLLFRVVWCASLYFIAKRAKLRERE